MPRFPGRCSFDEEYVLKLNDLEATAGVPPGIACFSWFRKNLVPGIPPVTEFQVHIASTPEKLEKGDPDVWDSGWVQPDKRTETGVRWPAPSTVTGKHIFCRVQFRSAENSKPTETRIKRFSIFPSSLGKAFWIGGAGYYRMRRLLNLVERPVAATLFIAADPHSYAQEYWQKDCNYDPSLNWLLGGSWIKYRIYVNHNPVALGPSRSVAGNPVLQAVDLTDYLQSGANVIGIDTLGEKHGVAALILITSADGSESIISTDGRWKIKPIENIYRAFCWEHPNMDHFFKGFPGPGDMANHIDGRNHDEGWLDPEFDDSKWLNPLEEKRCEEDLEMLTTQNQSLYLQQPEHIEQVRSNCYIVDFGRLLNGGVSIRMPDDYTGRVEVRLGEEKTEADTVRFQLRTGNCYQEMWRFQRNREALEHFGLRSFRYAEIIVHDHDKDSFGAIPIPEVSARQMHYPFNDDDTTLDTSDPMLNQVWELCKYSVKALNADIYIDCPSRERQAYEADAYINMLAHACLSNDYTLGVRTARYLLRHPTWPAEWHMFMVPVCWEIYWNTGDKSFLNEVYGSLTQIDCLQVALKNGLCDRFPRRIIVDWPMEMRDDYDFGPFNTVANCFLYWNYELLTRIARVLGRNEDSRKYSSLAAEIKFTINNRLFDEERGLFADHAGSKNNSFHANLFALFTGVVDPNHLQGCIDFVKSCGMRGSPYSAHFLLMAMFKYGEAAHAMSLMTDKGGNSWGCWINQYGATTTGEAWHPKQKENMSWAHPWGTSPITAIVKGVFGINALEPNWNRVLVKPNPAGLDWGTLKLMTPRGPMAVTISRRDDGAVVSNVEHVPEMQVQVDTSNIQSNILVSV